MLLDGYHNRKRYGSIQASEKDKIFDNNVVADIKTTIKHDITSCLSRMVASIKQTKNSVTDFGCDSTAAKGRTDNQKSTFDRILNEQFKLKDNSRLTSEYSQQRSKSVKQMAQQQWIPYIKCNLSRSVSVKQRRVDTSRLKLHYQFSTDNCNAIADKKKKFTTRGDALRCSRSDKTDVWPSGLNKFTVASLMPILAYSMLFVQPILVDSTPLAQEQYSLRPIWLTDGLINLDQNQDSGMTTHSSREDQDEGGSHLERVLLDVLNETQQKLTPQQYLRAGQESLTRNEPIPSWSPFGRDVLDYTAESERLEPSVEKLGIQRRRLDRNRALEPPTWLRQQPMRRGYNPIDLSEEGNLERSAEGEENSLQDDAKKIIPGRKLRQSSDEIYDVVLKHLIEKAFQDQDFFAEVYDELERRYKSNPQSTMIVDGPSLQLKQQQHQQKLPNQQSSKPGINLDQDDSSNGLDQYTDQSPSLIVVNDEVSSGDGPADEPANQDSSAIIKEVTSSKLFKTDKPSPPSSSFRDEIMNRLQQQQSLDEPTITDLSETSAKLDNSPYTFEMRATENEPLQSRYSASMSQEPFHVLEEIDLIDDSRPMLLSQQQASQSNGDDNDDDDGGRRSPHLSVSNTDWSNFPRAHEPSAIADPDSGGSSVASKRNLKLPSMAEILQMRDSLSLANYYEASRAGPKKLFGQQAAAATQPVITAKGSKVGIALRMIESGYLNREQLVQVAAKLKAHLEDMLGLMEGSIVNLYPINPLQLLIKLDTSKLSTLQMMDMIQKYGKYYDGVCSSCKLLHKLRVRSKFGKRMRMKEFRKI